MGFFAVLLLILFVIVCLLLIFLVIVQDEDSDSIGGIFSGALITEVVFGIPGLGMLSYRAITNFDYSLIMGVSIFSIVGVSVSVLIVDLLYPIFDPRIRLN